MYGAHREPTNPLHLGAVKTNIGHLEGSSGIAGFLKLLLCLKKKAMPPNLHFERLNPHIDLNHFPCIFPTSVTSLDSPKRLFGAVSSFGFGGANAHVVVEEAGTAADAPDGEEEAPEMAAEELEEEPQRNRRRPFEWVVPAHGLLGKREVNESGEIIYSMEVRRDVFECLGQHVVHGRPIFPAAAYMEAMAAAKASRPMESDRPIQPLFTDHSTVVVLEEIEFQRPLEMVPPAGEGHHTVQIMTTKITPDNSVTIASRMSDETDEVVQCSARLATDQAEGFGASMKPAERLAAFEAKSELQATLETDDFYSRLWRNGLMLGSKFRSVTSILVDGDQAKITISLPEPVRSCELGFRMHPAVLDASFQAIGAVVLAHDEKELQNEVKLVNRSNKKLMVPFVVERIALGSMRDHQLKKLLATVKLVGRDDKQAIADIEFMTPTGDLVVAIRRLTMRTLDLTPLAEIPRDLLWRLEWFPGEKTKEDSEVSRRAGATKREASVMHLLVIDYCAAHGQQVEQLKSFFGEDEVMVINSDDPAIVDAAVRRGLPRDSAAAAERGEDTVEGSAKEAEEQKFATPSSDFTDETASTAEAAAPSEERGWDAIIFLALETSISVVAMISGFLSICNVLRQLPRKAELPCVWAVTESTQRCSETDWVEKPHHAGIWGFSRSARLELEGVLGSALKLGCIDIPSSADLTEAIRATLLRQQSEPFEPELAFRYTSAPATEEPPVGQQTGPDAAASQLSLSPARDEFLQTYVSRLTRSPIAVRGSVELHMRERGAISNLFLRAQANAARTRPESNLCELRVRSAGLNFRDVLNVMGLYPGDPGPPGGDCAGTVIALGNEVDHLKVGDPVYGIAPGCLKTYVTTDAQLLRRMPESLTFAQAAALPVVAATVEYALGDLAKVKRGDRVLVHAVSGGVGIAAIQFCQRVGATVYGTCGSEKKRQYVEWLGVQFVTSSRDAAKFQADMEGFLGADGKIDVVLNSLIEDFIPGSLRFLAKNGRFMELGKRGIWNHEQVKAARPDVQYETIALDLMMEENPRWFGGMLDRIRNLVLDKQLRPLPIHEYDLTDSSEGAVAAFRFMQKAQHVGKVVVSIPSVVEIDPQADPETPRSPSGAPVENHKTFVISGGLGGLGMVVARWLVEEGARYVVLLSRSGRPSKHLQESPVWRQLVTPNSRATILPMKCDVASKDEVVQMFDELKARGLPNVRGIFHAAGVTADAGLAEQSAETIERVYRSKVVGAWNLHEACEELGLNKTLAIFMMFSSVTALFGNYGQTNYSAANACLDALALHRRSQGLCGQSVQWGPWLEQGMAVNMKQHLEKVGMKGISNELGIRVLGDVIANSKRLGVVCCQSIAWKTFLQR